MFDYMMYKVIREAPRLSPLEMTPYDRDGLYLTIYAVGMLFLLAIVYDMMLCPSVFTFWDAPHFAPFSLQHLVVAP